MGQLLRFAARPKPVEDGPVISGGARILMFTGVRYEREAPPPADDDAADGKRRKRKRG